jgi:multiple antibiotic resistance protein
MTLVSAVLKLLLVMDPIGNAIHSVQLLKDVKGSRRRVIILRESLIALGILLACLFGGRYMLDAMGIREPALAIAGGVVMLLIALRMIFMSEKDLFADDLSGEPLVVPIATPLMAGPSAISVVLLLASHDPTRIGEWSIALVIVCTLMAMSMLTGQLLGKALGEKGAAAVQKLLGMILTAVAIQMLITGIENYLASRAG